MNLQCIVCLISKPMIEDVKTAITIANGQTVCEDHIQSVMSKPGTVSVLIGKDKVDNT